MVAILSEYLSEVINPVLIAGSGVFVPIHPRRNILASCLALAPLGIFWVSICGKPTTSTHHHVGHYINKHLGLLWSRSHSERQTPVQSPTVPNLSPRITCSVCRIYLRFLASNIPTKPSSQPLVPRRDVITVRRASVAGRISIHHATRFLTIAAIHFDSLWAISPALICCVLGPAAEPQLPRVWGEDGYC